MVSVIIPTFNAEANIGALISSLRSQSVECQIIIVDSSSLDRTTNIAISGNARLVEIKKSDFGHGKTRNVGMDKADTASVLLLTQDALPLDNLFIENLIQPLEDPQIVASFGRQIPRPDASPTETFTRLFNYPDRPMVKGREDLPQLGIKTFFFSNVCSAIKTKEFKELGGFPENIVMFEDLIFAAKAILKGYKIAYVPDAKVLHSHNFSLIQQFRRYRDAGISLHNNSWLFEHVKPNREGAKFLKQQIAYLSRNRQLCWIPHALAESVFKYAGFWIGLHATSSNNGPLIASSRPHNA